MPMMNKMKFLFGLMLLWLIIPLLAGFLGERFFGLNLWVGFGIALAGIIISGIIVQIEDDF
jgi:thiol:disulfide interchange protein